jgi:hypothetical protein
MTLRRFGLLALTLWAGDPAWAGQRDATLVEGPQTERPTILAQGGCKNFQAYNACVAPKLIGCNNARYTKDQHDRCTAAASVECTPACSAP